MAEMYTLLGKELWIIPIIAILSLTICFQYSFAINDDNVFEFNEHQGIIVNDPNLRVDEIVDSLEFPTSMAFLGSDDILVLEKNQGTVKRIVNGQVLKNPLLDVNVGNTLERGMLGIAISNRNNTEHDQGKTFVFLYFTETRNKDGEDETEGVEPTGNRLYRYELENNKLVRPKLLLDIPAKSYVFHNGGKILIGPDNNLYLGVGDFFSKNTTAENVEKGSEPDGTSGILRITQDGKPVGRGILGDTYPLNLYYAYGIRNSFGMDFDPVSGKLWDTENGPDFGDEINLVEPGFNSGWSKIQGFWKAEDDHKGRYDLYPSELVNFNGNGKYSKPEFVWEFPVGPTALKFFDSDKLGKQYQNDMFVGDFHNGNIYHFDLEKNRSGVLLHEDLDDKIANSKQELQPLIFGTGFGGITDLVISPEGYLYVLALHKGGDSCKTTNGPCIKYNSEKGASLLRVIPENTRTENITD